ARPTPSVPQVVALPVAAAQTPAPIAPAPAAKPSPRAGAPQMVQLQFPNSDVADVLRFYEQLTGKKLVMDNFVQGKVNIFIAKEVPREEAIKIIEMNLLLNGYSLVPSEDSDIVKSSAPEKIRVPPACRLFPMKPRFLMAITSSVICSSCAMPIRRNCSRRWDNIFRRRSLTPHSWHCQKQARF